MRQAIGPIQNTADVIQIFTAPADYLSFISICVARRRGRVLCGRFN
jgi:hypothetical protein